MNTPSEVEPTEISDEISDEELSEFAGSLQAPSDEERRVYDEKFVFMEGIHDEIRLKNKRFMPIYEPPDPIPVSNDKYLDLIFNVADTRHDRSFF